MISILAEEDFDAAMAAMEPTAESQQGELASEIAKDELRSEVQRLAQLEPVDYERERAAVAAKFNIRRSVLDELISAYQSATTQSSEGKGTSLDLRPPIPWHERIDGDRLLSSMVSIIHQHVVLPAPAAVAVALWVLFTYLLDCFSHSPRLALTSPTPRCGKTTLLEVIVRTTLKALPASNITPAAVFRTIEACLPTLLIDEADTFLRDNDELRGVLNSGHSRAAAFVIRTVGDDHEPRKFSTWCPLAIALIGKLPATLQDRAIEVALKRKTTSETVQRLGPEAYRKLDIWARKAARWAADHTQVLTAAAPAIPAGLDNRAEDNWRPLVAIADAAGGRWPTIARQAAVTLSAAREEGSIGILLLSDLRTLFLVQETDALRSEKICEELAKMESRPWPEYRRGRPITMKQLAALLRPFAVSPATIGKEAKGYRLKWLQEAFDRYLPPLTPVSAVEASNSFSPNGLDHFFDPSTDPTSDGSKMTVGATPPKASTVRQQENRHLEPDEEQI
jgi:hypothetical protein